MKWIRRIAFSFASFMCMMGIAVGAAQENLFMVFLLSVLVLYFLSRVTE